MNLEHLLKVIDPEPVLIDHQACLAARHRRSACRACVNECPDQALSLQNGKVTVDSGKCSRCSLCSAHCPTSAISVRGVDDALVVGAAQVHCSKAEGSGVKLPCLGYLTADHLLAMALRHEAVNLVCGDCAGCRWRAGGEMAKRVVETANNSLAAVGSSHRIRLEAGGAGKREQQQISRRELFNLWRVESVQVARQLAPEKEINHAKLPAKLPVRRTRWLRQLNPASVPSEAQMPAGPWRARAVTDACNGCSVCVSFCPTGALSSKEEAGDWILTHQAAACVACETCVSLCPTRAVTAQPLLAVQMVEGGQSELVRMANLRCRSCRKEFRGRSGETQCPQCRSVFSMLNL